MAGVSVRPLSANSDRTHRSKTVLIRSPRRRWRAPQVRRLLTLEDPIDVASRAPELVDVIRSIGDQAAARHEVDVGIDRDGAELSAPRSYAAAAKNRRARRVGCDLPEQFRPLPAHAVLERGDAGRVAPGPCQARDKARADRVDDRAEHDR